MRDLTRRQFVRLVGGEALLSALGACTTGREALPTPPLASEQLPFPPPPPTAEIIPTPSLPILRNENRPGFFVRYYRPFEAVDPQRWTLSVEGLVGAPQQLSLSDMLSFPRASQVSRMKCVECWSAAAKWEGFHVRSLLEIVNPRAEARWLHLHCADGYYESMSLEFLMGDRVLFAHHMNDEILPDIYGAPLRIMVPSLYGYKSAKAIVRLEFAAEELPGYWPTVGPYTTHGVIRPGPDHPLDLEGSRSIKGGGEIFYPDGIESREQPGT